MFKNICLIRHAQGYHNVNCQYHIHNPSLTPLGFNQCLKAKETIKEFKYDLILVSPLTRTLQTATNIFGKVPMKSIETIREHIENPCDLRCNIDHLQSQYLHINFSELLSDQDPVITDLETKQFNPESPQDVAARSEKVIEYLKSLKETNIAIVSHYGFISYFLRSIGYDKKIYLENCESISISLPIL